VTTTVEPDKRVMVAYALYATIFVEGIMLASIGPSLDAFADQTASTTEQIAIVFTANSLGYIVGSLVAGRAYSRLTGNTVLAAGLVATALLTVFLPIAGNLLVLVLLLAGIGIAIGVIDVGCNTLLVWLFGSDVPPYMNTLHLGFGVGAVITPLIIDRFAVAGDATNAYWLFAAVMLPIALWVYRKPSPRPPQSASGKGDAPSVVRRYAWLVGLTAVLFFMHMGAQLSFAGWIFSYAEELGNPETTARLLNSLFWAGLVGGRLVAIPLSKHMRPSGMIRVNLVGAAASIGLMALLSDSSPALWIGTIGFGASIASMFASSINFAERRMPITSQTTSIFLVGGSGGMMTLPWLVGQFFDSRGPGTLTWVVGGAVIAAVAVFALMSTVPTTDEQ